MVSKGKYQNRNSFLTKPLKFYCSFALLVSIITLLYLFWKYPEEENSENALKDTNSNSLNAARNGIPVISKGPAFKGEKIVHFDLKGAPPKITYFEKIFPLIKLLGATGILLEYEDMFPYSNELANISAFNAYKMDDIRSINKLAKENGLDVIPLVQTFGHLEFLLKLKDFKEYREVYSYPQVICPTHENTVHLLTSMIEQIVKAHPDIKTIHIGADEVYYLGQCSRCMDFMSQYSFTKNQLFLEHINNVVSAINKLFPKLKILMWDDQFRSMSTLELKRTDLSKKIEPVVWKYTKDVYDDLGPTLWENYSKKFKNVWVASAFKGATGSNEFLSDVTHYLQNHRSWMSVIEDYKNMFNFQGIILTGWQRYDHFAVLCELLPVAIPSLAMNLRLLLGYNNSPLSPPTEVAKILQCEQPYALIGPAFGSPRCSYPGGAILESVIHLQQLKQEFESLLDDSRMRGWINDYNIKFTFSSPSYVEGVTSSLNRIKGDLEILSADLTWSMSEIYDSYTIEEFTITYIKPLEKKINELLITRNMLLEKEYWPRRPLKSNEL